MNSFHEKMEEYSFPFYGKKHINVKQRLGSGAIGSVYKGELTIFGDTIDCVIKKVSSDNYTKNRHMYQDIIDEVDIGHRFMSKGKQQIQFYGYTTYKEKDIIVIYLLMELTQSKGDLASYLSSDNLWKKLTKREYNKSTSPTKMYHEISDAETLYWDYIIPVKDKLHLIKSLCESVHELHSFNIVHCDLKSPNMLFTGKTIKLIDYNASYFMDKVIEMQGVAEMGTCGYMAPEMYDGGISYQADIYSIGVCMLEIWFGDIWPTNTNDYKTCRRYVLDYLNLLKKDNEDLYKLVKRCISTDPTKRPLMKTILSNLPNTHEGLEIAE